MSAGNFSLPAAFVPPTCLPRWPDHAVVKQYYKDLFDGRLGFKLVKTFKTYPSLFGLTINDDDAELTFRLFDHPRVFVFLRQ